MNRYYSKPNIKYYAVWLDKESAIKFISLNEEEISNRKENHTFEIHDIGYLAIIKALGFRNLEEFLEEVLKDEKDVNNTLLKFEENPYYLHNFLKIVIENNKMGIYGGIAEKIPEDYISDDNAIMAYMHPVYNRLTRSEEYELDVFIGAEYERRNYENISVEAIAALKGLGFDSVEDFLLEYGDVETDLDDKETISNLVLDVLDSYDDSPLYYYSFFKNNLQVE